MITNKYQELHSTGSVRLYESEGFNLTELMQSFDIMLDPEYYSFGLIENNTGTFIEIIKYN
jgi:hypothetical protein